jgi:hypothetical protein
MGAMPQQDIAIAPRHSDAVKLSENNLEEKTSMICEIITTTCWPGSMAPVVEIDHALESSVREDNCGKLEGYWMTEIGPLNQILQLRSYSDLDEQRRAAKDRDSQQTRAQALATTASHIVNREVSVFCVMRGISRPTTGAHFYELRRYRIKPLQIERWTELFLGSIEYREKYSKLSVLLRGEDGAQNEVCHLWPYPDLNARTAARAAAVIDPEWKEFIRASGALLESMQSMIMIPAKHSPLK